MDKNILKGCPLPKEWMKIPTSSLAQFGIEDVEDTLVVLGAYINVKNVNQSCIVYSYGENYDEFLDEYLGLIYDNKTEDFLPKNNRPAAFADKDIVNISSTNQKYGKRNFMVHIFKTVQGRSVVGYSAQFFVVYNKNLINFTISVGDLDEKDAYNSMLTKNASIRKFIIEYLAKL